MSDYRVIIRVKNNLLHELMLANNITTQSELARAINKSNRYVGDVANLKVGAFNADGRPSAITQALTDYFGCLPEDIYPPEVLHVGLPSNVVERVVSSEEVAKYITQNESDPALLLEGLVDRKLISHHLHRLTPNQRAVIELRYFEEKTFLEVGQALGFTSAGVGQIERKALKKLREMAGVGLIEDNSNDASASGLATRLEDGVKEVRRFKR
ncbi:MAG: sigma-70 family RNA polymerase sigma factor [Colwellia sp.]|nr:sigma-70 family RNA polymerase sigma factor [Colwellia sp.]